MRPFAIKRSKLVLIEICTFVCVCPTAIRYLQLHDLATTPGGGSTPLESWPVAASGGLLNLDQVALGSLGVPFSTGLTWAFSTTALTYTAGTATDAIVTVRYV